MLPSALSGNVAMTISIFLATAALAFAPPTGPIASAPAAPAQPADFHAQAQAMLDAAFPADGPGAAAIVTRGGQVIYAGGRGMADVAAGRPITPDTRFRLGSIAKQFTAALVLGLVAEARISLDDPISRFFPDWPQPTAAATVRQLLNHTSGMQDFSKIPGWIGANRHRDFSTAELLALFRTLPARAEPGRAWEYNNGGYVMLGAIVEQVTGKTLTDAVAERIGRPLGLDRIASGTIGVAQGYTAEDGRQQAVRASALSFAQWAASVSEMARWAQALHHGGVVSPALYEEMTSPARLADGGTRPYGFGLRLQRLLGRRALVHGGAGAGLDTDSVYLPQDDVFVAVFANSDDPATDPSTLTRRLAALALGQPFPTFTRAEVPVASVEPLLGAYRSERASAPPLSFFSRDGKYFLASGDEEMEATPAGSDSFFFDSDTLSWLSFTRQADGAHVMEVHEPQRAVPERAIRTGAVPPPLAVPAAVLQSYVGTYQTETVAVTVALGANGWLTISGGGRRLLRCGRCRTRNSASMPVAIASSSTPKMAEWIVSPCIAVRAR
jgi:D-alanyl-D-alanine carboxypeptidase